jgi:hypothetical protein
LAKRGTRDINPVDRGLFKTIQQGEIDMARYRGRLPQLDGQLFLTDGGIETTLIFHDRLDLPFFAAFDLLKGAEGTAALKRYFSSHAGISRDAGVGFIFESATWRASPDWGTKLGYSAAAVDTANRKRSMYSSNSAMRLKLSARRWSSAAALARRETATTRML